MRLLGLVWLTNDGEPHQGASIIKLEQRRKKERGSKIFICFGRLFGVHSILHTSGQTKQSKSNKKS